MAKFEVTVTDADKLAALEAAAVAGGRTSAEQVQYLIDKATESYAKTFAPSVVSAKEAYEAEVKRIDDKFNPKVEVEKQVR